MNATPSDPNSAAKRNQRTLERLRQIAQEPNPHPKRRRHLRTLVDRMEYLEKTIAAHDCSAGAESRYRAERGALAWVIAEITQL